MSRIKSFLNKTIMNLKETVFRFPLVLIFLASLTIVLSMTIENVISDEELIRRLLFTGIFGALLATAVQFAVERFKNLSKYTLILHAAAVLLSAAYYYFMTNDDISPIMVVHLFVISFALFAAYLYLPSAKNEVDFGNVALTHFKAAFIAILYGVVLFLGFAAIFEAVDILLYNINSEVYAHTAVIAFIFFTPSYYLSLLPKFNSTDEADIKRNEASYSYPRVLDILVSNIMIPLISIFSVVLIIYFLKILITGVWPVGQVGPMVLGYSAAGYFIYILDSKLDNRFSLLYRRIFPVALIPLVAMQLVSAYIRIEAYGITESRYYIVLFGIFSLICALMIIFGKKKNPNSIVLLSLIFALISIIPPVDAFTVSSKSQEARLEEILLRNNMLADNKIVHSKNISNEDKYEITSISDYMARMGHLNNIEWFPEEYADWGYYGSFESIYGFSPYYDNSYGPGEGSRYSYASLDDSISMDVSGYDRFIKANIYSRADQKPTVGTFETDGVKYTVEQETDSLGYVTLKILNDSNNVLIEISMKELTDHLFEKPESKYSLPPEDLTIEAENESVKLKVTASEINIDRTGDNVYMGGNLFLFVSVK